MQSKFFLTLLLVGCGAADAVQTDADLIGGSTPATPASACAVIEALEAGTCRAVEARDVRVLAAGGLHMPGFGFAQGGDFLAFGARYNAGTIVATVSTDLRSFTTPQPLPWQPTSDVTGASIGDRHALYFVGQLEADVGRALYVSTVRGNLVDPPARVTIQGTDVRPFWPQATGLADGRTLLAFVEAQKHAFLAVDDGSGVRFQARPWPNVEGELRGVLGHVGTTNRGAWVITHQVADASWAFKAYVQLSQDGEQWSSPQLIQADDPNIHDAFPIARRDEGADLYYLRAGLNGLNVRRRALGEDGTLGPEQIVTTPEVGHVEKPQPRRLPDGRIALMFSARRSEQVYDLAMAVLEGDAPR